MSKYLQLIRIKHWLKNGIIFLPIFFSIHLFDGSYIFTAILAFFVFSFTSSIVYVLNDINDIEKDKLHPVKKKRPLAAGVISKEQAYFVTFLIAFCLIICMYLLYIESHNIFVFVIPLTYLLMNILYSKWLKHIPIMDVVTIVIGFVLRVMYGGVVTQIDVSKYLYLMIIFGSFYLGFGKRRNEIIKNGEVGRKVLKFYNQDFLDKNMYVSLSLAIVSYTLWCVDPVTVARIGHDYLFWTIPLLMIILQLYSLDIEGNSHGDPIEVILSDKKLIFAGLLYIVVLGGLLYLL